MCRTIYISAAICLRQERTNQLAHKNHFISTVLRKANCCQNVDSTTHHIFRFIYMYIYIVHIFMSTCNIKHIYIYAYAHIYTYIHVYIHIHTYMCTYIYIHSSDGKNICATTRGPGFESYRVPDFFICSVAFFLLC